MNTQQKAFAALTVLLRDVLGTDMGITAPYTDTSAVRNQLANEIFGDFDMSDVDIDQEEKDAVNGYRIQVLEVNPEITQDAFFQELITLMMRDMYIYRTQRDMTFGNLFGQLEVHFYQTLLTSTIFTTSEGDENDQTCTRMNASNFDLEFRT